MWESIAEDAKLPEDTGQLDLDLEFEQVTQEVAAESLLGKVGKLNKLLGGLGSVDSSDV
jgi:predicted component of type VI protein secretion system